MSENCRVYWLYLITTYKYKSNKIWSLKHTFDKKKKKSAHAYFGRLYFFLSFLAGKLRHFNWMLLTALQKKEKKSLAHAYFKHPVFFKFFGGKIKNIFWGMSPEFLNEKKMEGSY